VSLDVGITPALGAISGAAEHAIAVKPIGRFLARFDELLARCRDPAGPRRIAVIGGGAGGVELILSARTRVMSEAGSAGLDPKRFSFVLITAGDLLQGHNDRVKDSFRRLLAKRGIEVHEKRAVYAVSEGRIAFADDAAPIPADAILVATEAAPPEWFGDTGLSLDHGFVAAGPTLQSLNDPDVFAAGDCAALCGRSRIGSIGAGCACTRMSTACARACRHSLP
jgi:selenide,water dikinase